MSKEDKIPFMKFPKIYENTGEFKAPKKIDWIATEKIDGSNFSVYSDGEIVKFAKRTGFLKENEWFYNYQLISLDLSKKAKAVYKMLNTSQNPLKFVVIYGELCGGWFPKGSDWKGPIPTRINEKGVIIVPLEQRAIQEGVYYSDQIHLIVFDIAYVDQKGTFQYLEYDEMVSVCNEVSLFYTPALMRTTLQKLLDYSLEFDSTIPPLFGLPRINNNTAEGIVIRPSAWKGPDRPMLKRKNKKFHQFSGDFDINAVKKNPFFVANCMINQNRLNGVISKVGPKADKNVIIEEFVKDVWDSIWELGIPVPDYDAVDAHIRKISEPIIDEYISGLDR